MQNMAEASILDQIARSGVVPVIAIEKAEYALPLADALLQGGLLVIEITFRTAAAAEVIRQISTARPHLLVGAGTVLNSANLEAAAANGAAFAVAPGLNSAIIKHAQRLNLPFVPGVATPTEIEAGLELGCKLLKFFPAEALGGVQMLEALSAPYKHTGMRFMPTGGISPYNLESYLKLETVAAVGGTWIARKDDLIAGKWPEIRARCQAAAELVRNLRPTR